MADKYTLLKMSKTWLVKNLMNRIEFIRVQVNKIDDARRQMVDLKDANEFLRKQNADLKSQIARGQDAAHKLVETIFRVHAPIQRGGDLCEATLKRGGER